MNELENFQKAIQNLRREKLNINFIKHVPTILRDLADQFENGQIKATEAVITTSTDDLDLQVIKLVATTKEIK